MSPAPAVPGIRYLTTRTAVADFFDLVMKEQLSFPAVVVTKPSHEAAPYIPLDDLYEAIGDIADIYFLDSAAVDIREVVPRRAGAADLEDVNVYGGATRMFPAGRWDSARLFMARSPEEGKQRVRAITGHVKSLLNHRGSLSYTTSTSQNADAVRRESDSVKLVAAEAENTALRERVRKLEAQLAAATRSKPASKPKTGPVPVHKPVRRMFADADAEIRFRVMALWAEQTTPAEKQESPLPKYTFGEGFAASLDELSAHNPQLLDKVARCVLRILLGQDRDGHKLDTTGKVREDGAVAWRSYVEQNTASARRLHYWRKPGGQVELGKVVLHDDYSI